MCTVLFCGLRVTILYSVDRRKTRTAIIVLPILFLIIGGITAIQHFISDGLCLQMGSPYPFGAITVISSYYSNNVDKVATLDMIFIAFACFSIIICNILMFKKLRQRKLLNIQRSSSENLKVERTLTVTVVILLIPLLIHILISTCLLLQVFYTAPLFFASLSIMRRVLLETQTHIVTFYFYFTHPIFKNDRLFFKTPSFKFFRFN